MPTETMVAASARPTYDRAGDVVGLLKRTEPLRETLAASAVIGPRGGRLHIPAAGIRVEFPRGAVATPTRITVTAMRGGNVAYQFEPHGLVFREPVTVSQSLRGTAAWKTSLAEDLHGSYFDRLIVDPSETFARRLEKREGKLRDSKTRLEFSIEHFSGYMVSVGDGPRDIKVEVTIDITGR